MKKLALGFTVLVSLAVVAVALFGASSPSAKADLPPGSVCLTPQSTPTPGGVPITSGYMVVAALPTDAPLNANGLCITLSGTPGQSNSAAVVNADGCSAVTPTPNAADSYVSSSWGSSNCYQPGQRVWITFKSGPVMPSVASVTWNLGGGTPQAGSATIQRYGSVGGEAEPPGSSGSLAANAGSSDSAQPYALIAGALMGAVVLMLAGAWYIRRRLT